jgi:ATP-dependent exoDNAse (exonuclease V) alpha subunit
MAKEPLELNAEFRYILDEIEKTNKHLFITGKAGTGKSTLLQLFKNTTRKKTVVVAPTGIAALNVGGQTIHSFFGFGPRLMQKHEIKRRFNKKLYENIEVLIIDEISMVRADIMDNMDYFLRLNRDNSKPFGGVQVVLFGDLFQLPPVVSSPEEQLYFQTYYKGPYFFYAKVFDNEAFKLDLIELRKIYRQEERHFIRLLETVRTNRMDYEDLEDLNLRYDPKFESGDNYITLTTRNMIADQINERALKQIESPTYLFQARIEGDFDPRNFPTETMLQLKLGAQVMFIKNDAEKRYVNGSVGRIVKLDDENIHVELEEKNGGTKVVEVTQASWEMLRYKASETDISQLVAETIGSFKQYPLKMAWAITIHKSQGKTFDKVIIDLGKGAFESGQTYVALSRCRSLGGIVLRQKIRPQDVMTDERIVEYYERF